MTLMPAKTGISDTYPNPSNATARAAFAQLHDAMFEHLEKAETNIASAATMDIGGATNSGKLIITGVVTVTSLGSNYRGPIIGRVADAAGMQFTHNATTVKCPNGENLICQQGDIILFAPAASISGTNDGWNVTRIARGTKHRVIIASHATTGAIWANAIKDIDWTGTATTTAFPNANYAGEERILHCAAACKFTAGANLIISGVSSGDFDAAAGDIVRVYAITTSQFRLVISRANGEAVAAGAAGIPVGMVIDFANDSVPTGFVNCDGSAVSRTVTYAALFAVVGTTWGVGDGSTTFNLPDLRRYVTMGKGGTSLEGPGNSVGNTGGNERHTLTEAQMPAHSHTVTPRFTSGSGGDGSVRVVNKAADNTYNTNSKGSSASHPIIQPTAVMTKCIKY